MNFDLATAAVLALAGFMLGLRQIVLAPDNLTFPKAPGIVRAFMFGFAMIQAGVAVIFWGAAATPGDYAGPAALWVFVLFAAACAYNAVMLVNIARQRYRPEVWARIHKVHERVRQSCAETKLAFPAPLHIDPHHNSGSHHRRPF